MSTTVVQFRIEESLKDDANALFENLGLDMPTAFRMFLKKCVAKQEIPFKLKTSDKKSEKFRKAFYYRNDAKKNNLQDMSLDEINGIIGEVRAENRG